MGREQRQPLKGEKASTSRQDRALQRQAVDSEEIFLQMAKIAEESKVVYNYLGRSGLKVANLCLGTMTFGESQSDEDMSHQILNRYAEWGGNFLDTADVYSLGRSEEIIGSWLEKQPRDNFIIATKVLFDTDVINNVNGGGLSRRHITEGIEKSLTRLCTDYVDLYQTHGWDDATPIEETMRTLDDLVRAGKIRYIGVSNVSGWQLQKLVDTTEKLGLNPIVSLQQQYSLASRFSEVEPFQVCKTAGIGVLPWSPLKGGLLSGKFKRGVTPAEGRLGWMTENEAMRKMAGPSWTNFDDKTWDMIEAAEAIAKKHDRSMAQVALRWLLQKDVVPSVIIGARTLAQLDDNMGAANGWSLSPEEMQQLDELSHPDLPYPYEMIFKFNTGRTNPYYADNYVHSK